MGGGEEMTLQEALKDHYQAKRKAYPNLDPEKYNDPLVQWKFVTKSHPLTYLYLEDLFAADWEPCK